jgi:pimeloyl-ACP methyl ester carboxylesterase
MQNRHWLLLSIASIAGGAYAAYRKDLKAAEKRIAADQQVIHAPLGPIEFAESGDGPAVLVIHGAGGGFDQGLDLGRAFLGDGFRIVAPSRFGYLGTPLPSDASPEAQADAHLRLLDALQLDTVPVVAISAGAPSAMQVCLKHPDRCSALVLVVPGVYAPQDANAGRTSSPFFEIVLNTIAASDLIFWTATKVARPAIIKTILGTPVDDYRRATRDERRNVDALLKSILPISRRFAGIWNDGIVGSSLQRYPLEDLAVPTLLITTKNDLYGTYQGSLYSARHIPHAKLTAFATGGHMLLGHDVEVGSEIAQFLQSHQLSAQEAAPA